MTKSLNLRMDIVQTILITCMNEVTTKDLVAKIKETFYLPEKELKRYLFYLTNYKFLSYDGKRQILITENMGYDFLNAINIVKIL
jgi:hypothetical protein